MNKLPKIVIRLLATLTPILLWMAASPTSAKNPPSSQESPWCYEPFLFNGTNQPLNSLKGGEGFGGAWKGGIYRGAYSLVRPTVQFTGLTYPGLRSQPGGVRVGATDSLLMSQRLLPEEVKRGLTNGAVFYLSVLMRPEGKLNEGALNGYFCVGLDGENDGVFMGKPGADRMDRYVVETQGGMGQVASDVSPKVGETALLVMKVEIREGNDRITLFVNPTPGKPEPATGVVKQDTDLGDLKGVALYSTGAHVIDELRVGGSFASVVPEDPSLR